MSEMDDEEYKRALAAEVKSLNADLKEAQKKRDESRDIVIQLEQEVVQLQNQKIQREQLLDMNQTYEILKRELEEKEGLKELALQELVGAQRQRRSTDDGDRSNRSGQKRRSARRRGSVV